MKRSLLLLIMLIFSSCIYAQSTEVNDQVEIIKLVVDKFNKNGKNIVYYRFDNRSLLNDLFLSFSGNIEFDHSDSAIIKLKDIDFKYWTNSTLLKKTNNKRINPFLKRDYIKNWSNKPTAYISFPLISIDGENAIVYARYVCGGLCGSSGYFYLKKTEDIWTLIEYIEEFIS
ncbi:hypothetical protein NU10_01115 [Flavobacterium dauae]|uniref:hypothetical protein n=1 Tax=Flavobacterium dauae TaxID=1563479 RepID=UPI00101B307E|nr:hypothetical protein [Flavobacterium dauae]WLD24020.1 hypothetical protein NU10_01115 [Flavobacterium dauae]